MANSIHWPGFLTLNNAVRLPPTVMREYAGSYGVNYGFTKQTGINNGVITYSETPQQDAFRHAFVHGLYALSVNASDSRMVGQGAGLGGSLSDRFMSVAAPSAFDLGFANEFFASNPIEQHLHDLWNNGTGIELAYIYAKAHDFNYSLMSNQGFADFIADQIKNNPGLFIFEYTDPRIVNPSLYDLAFIPTSGDISLLHRSISLYNNEGLTPDLIDRLEAYFAVRCFPASTPIATSLTTNTPISNLRVGDTVFAYHPHANHGRGELVPRRVTRLFRNVTSEWIKLTWVENGEAKELVATPGHAFLDQSGNFPRLDEMLRDGTAEVVLASGAVVQVTAERIVYSAETAHLFEQAQAEAAVAGSLALAPQMLDGWQTYNIEVEELHTYVAGGVRVHNDSLYSPMSDLGHLADNISSQISDFAFGNSSLTGVFAGAALSSITSTAALTPLKSTRNNVDFVRL
jgi:hypothetical protein